MRNDFLWCCFFTRNWDAITALSTALLAFLTIIIAIYACLAHRENKKLLYANTVSNSRPSYIGTLRKAFASLYASLLSEDTAKILEALPYVIYHFNQYEGVGIDNAFIENCLNSILEKAKNGENISMDDIRKYRKWSASILQYEWQCFKDECLKGRKLTEKEKRRNKDKIIDSVLVGL